MTDQQSQQYQYPAPPQKKKHTVRNVLLILVLLFVLFIAGCMALIGKAADEASKSIDEETKNDTPTAIEEGKPFEHDGFAAAGGWKVAPEQFGGATIKGLKLTLKDDQGTSTGRSALLDFKLYNGKTVVATITCSSDDLQQGETATLECFSGNTKKLGKFDTIKVSDSF